MYFDTQALLHLPNLPISPTGTPFGARDVAPPDVGEWAEKRPAPKPQHGESHFIVARKAYKRFSGKRESARSVDLVRGSFGNKSTVFATHKGVSVWYKNRNTPVRYTSVLDHWANADTYTPLMSSAMATSLYCNLG